MKLTTKFAPAYARAVRHALGWEFVILVLGSLMTDMGESMKYFCLTSIVFWGAVGAICLRRPDQPTMLDLGFIQFGLPGIALLLPVANMAFLGRHH